MKQETLEEEPLIEFTLIEKELIEEAKKLWQESHPNQIKPSLLGLVKTTSTTTKSLVKIGQVAECWKIFRGSII